MKKQKLLDFFKQNSKYLPSFNDLLIVIGLCMTGNGLYMIYEPSMWIVIGVFVIYLGWPKKVVR